MARIIIIELRDGEIENIFTADPIFCATAKVYSHDRTRKPVLFEETVTLATRDELDKILRDEDA